MWYRFRFERKSLKFTILFITSGYDRKWRRTFLYDCVRLHREIYLWYKFHFSISYRFWEKGWTRWLFEKRKSAIFDDRKWILKKWKKRLGVLSFSAISENFKKIYRSISEKSAKQKKGKKRKNNNNNNKQYNLYKVFRLKRKTLITRFDLVASNE